MTSEKVTVGHSGWFHLVLTLGMTLVAAAVFGLAILVKNPWWLAIAIPVLTVSFVWWAGFFTLQPNEATLLSFFGPYVGTVRKDGFYWVNPFYSKRKISLRARNLEGAKLKVNDKRGNPIEIGVVVVWRVEHTAAAVFAIQAYEK